MRSQPSGFHAKGEIEKLFRSRSLTTSLRRVQWFSFLFPDALNFHVASQRSLSGHPREGRRHLCRMSQFKAGVRNVLLVGPGDVRDVAVFDPDAVERFGGRAGEWRSGGLVEEYVQE